MSVTLAEPLRINGACTSCSYDNLLSCLRRLFYECEARGTRPTRVRTSPRVLAAFDSCTLTTDIGVAQPTRFKGCLCVPDATLDDEWQFWCDDVLVGCLVGIS